MIIFGLGNPGLKYRSTKHNAGYMFLRTMAQKHKKRFSTHRGYKLAKLKIGDTRVNLIKPICWMNQSGLAIAKICQEFAGDFMVVLDDFNLPLGKIRLKSKGSDGGHLGLRSIITTLNSTMFLRLRIGVGPPDDDVVSFVLTSFTRNERKVITSVFQKGIRGIEIMLRQNFIRAQNYINSINIESDSNG